MGPTRQPIHAAGPATPRTSAETGSTPSGDAVIEAALSPINGVDLATYAWVTTQVANHGYQPDLAVAYAAERGVSVGDWTVAAIGWKARLEALPGLAEQFRACLDAT